MKLSRNEIKALLASGKIRSKDYEQLSEFCEQKNKYKSKKTIIDGISFDSKFEADRYAQLKLLQRAGEISSLRLQVPYTLIPSFVRNGKRIRAIVYKADFVYINNNGDEVVEDTKGYVTKEYALKKKLLLYFYPDIIFKEVKKDPP